MAGCATPTSSAGHAPASATTNPKLTFKSDHQAGADHLDVNALILLLVVVGIGFLALSIRGLEELPRRRESKAMHDALTGLPNPRYLREWLNIALAARGS
jgi:GGDEF domain-containing protein